MDSMPCVLPGHAVIVPEAYPHSPRSPAAPAPLLLANPVMHEQAPVERSQVPRPEHSVAYALSGGLLSASRYLFCSCHGCSSVQGIRPIYELSRQNIKSIEPDSTEMELVPPVNEAVGIRAGRFPGSCVNVIMEDTPSESQALDPPLRVTVTDRIVTRLSSASLISAAVAVVAMGTVVSPLNVSVNEPEQPLQRQDTA